MAKLHDRFAVALRRHRRQLGLTQPEVAAIAGVTVSTVSLVENGKANCTFDLAERLGAAVGIELVPQVRTGALPAAETAP